MCNLCHLHGNLGPLFVALPTFLEETSQEDKREKGRHPLFPREQVCVDLSAAFSLFHFLYMFSGFHSIKPSSKSAVVRQSARI